MAGRGRPKKTAVSTTKTVTKDTATTKPVIKEAEIQPRLYCIKCGELNPKHFYMTKDQHHAFFGKIPYCKSCIRNIYIFYLRKYEDMNLAVYYTCRKIDVPYIHSNYLGAVENINNTNAKITGEDAIIPAYMKGLSFAETNGWGTSFDDSQGESEIKKLYTYDVITKIKRDKINNPNVSLDEESADDYEILEYDTEVLQSKWGMTFENWELSYLEGEYLDWEEKLNGINDKTIEILVKQICYQLLDIYKDRQTGNSVDKKIKTLRELMSDSGLMEKQNKATEQRQNIGMTIRDIEYHKPIPNSTPIFDDVDGCKNYIFGAAGCYFKADGKENAYTRFYDEWMKEYSVDIITDNLEHKMEDSNTEKPDD